MGHVAYHFKVTVKREITLCQPHALVAFHKNFVQSEGKVLKAKRFVGGGEKIAERCQAPSSLHLLRTKGGRTICGRTVLFKLTNSHKHRRDEGKPSAPRNASNKPCSAGRLRSWLPFWLPVYSTHGKKKTDTDFRRVSRATQPLTDDQI